MRAAKLRNPYLALLKTQKSLASSSSSTSTATPTTPKGSNLSSAKKSDEVDIDQELYRIEELLPLSTLIVYRQLAMLDHLETIKKENETKKVTVSSRGWRSSSVENSDINSTNNKSTPVKSSWYSRMFGTKKEKEPIENKEVLSNSSISDNESESDNEVSLEYLQKQLEEGSTIDSAYIDLQYLFRFRFKSSALVLLTYSKTDILELKMALITNADLRASQFRTSLIMNDFHIKDLYSTDAFSNELLKVSTHSNSNNDVTTISSDMSSGDISIAPANVAGFTITCLMIDNDTTISITSLPFVLIWNKPTIVKLFEMFVWNKPDKISGAAPPQSNHNINEKNHIYGMETASLLNAYAMRQATSRMNASGRNDTNMIHFYLDAEAPKIIIPENYSTDNQGYLYIDAGHLSVRGDVSTKNITFDITMSSINAALPKSMHDLKRIGQNKTYLIRPFNINCDYKQCMNSNIDMDIRVVVTSNAINNEESKPIQVPSIGGELRAENLTSLLQIVSVIVASTTRPPAATLVEDFTEGFHPVLIASHDESNRLVNVDAEAVADLAESQVAVTLPTDPSHINIRVMVDIPKVALELKYETANDNFIELAVNCLQLEVVMRRYDIILTSSLGSLLVQDSQRHISQRDLARTPVDTPLVQIILEVCNSQHSIVKNEFKNHLRIVFSELNLNIDARTLLHLRPFVAVFLAVPASSTTPSSSSAHQLPELVSGPVLVPFSPENETSKTPAGIHIEVELGEVSLELLRYSILPREDNEIVNQDSILGILPSIFKISVKSLLFDMKSIGGKSEMNLTLESLTIFDTNNVRNDYVFRKVMYPKLLQCESMPNTSNQPNENNIQNTISNNNISKIITSDIKSKNYFIILKYVNTFDEDNLENGNQAVINIHISDVVTYMSVDMILDLTDVSMAITNSLQTLFKPVTDVVTTNAVPVSSAPYVQIQLQEAVATIKEDPKPSSIHLMVNIRNPILVLLEDPTLVDTRAVVIGCNVQFQYHSSGTVTDHVLDIKENSHFSLQDLHVSVAQGIKRWNLMKIIEPFSADLHYKRTMSKSYILTTLVSLDITNIVANVSLNDILLMQSILMRVYLFEPPDIDVAVIDNEKNHSNMNNVIQNSNQSNNKEYKDDYQIKTDNVNDSNNNDEVILSDATPMTLHDVTIRIGMIKLILINDFNDQNIPVLQCRVNDTELMVSGFLIDMTGSGRFAVDLDFYNLRNGFWEPVIEAWSPNISVTVTVDNTSISVQSNGTLQVNITGRMVQTLLETYSEIMYTDEGTLGEGLVSSDDGHSLTHGQQKQKYVHAVILKNNLGVPIQLRHSITKELLLDLNPYNSAPISVCSTSNSTSRDITECINQLDLHFMGDFMKENKLRPLIQLPLNSFRSKSYLVQSEENISTKVRNSIGSGSDKPAILSMEPVLEETWQYQRYDPLSGWRKPFLMHDPYEFSDRNGSGRRDRESIALPNKDTWKWQSDWIVDKRDEIGKNIDDDGW